MLLWLAMGVVASWCLLWSLLMAFKRRWRRSALFLLLTSGVVLLTLSGAVFSAWRLLALLGV